MLLKKKILLGFSIALILLIIQSATVGYFVRELQIAVGELEHIIRTQSRLKFAIASVDSVNQGLVNLSESDIDDRKSLSSAFEVIVVYIEDLKTHLDAIVEFNQDIQLDQQRLLEAVTNFDSELAILSDLVAGSEDVFEALEQSIFVSEMVLDLAAQFSIVEASYSSILEQALAKESKLLHRPTQVSLIVTAIATIVLTLYALFFARQITTPIRQLEQWLDAIAKGDLTKEALNLKGKDELAQLGGHVNSMTLSLREMISNITSVSSEIMTVASQVDLATNEQSIGVGKQKMETDKVAAAMNGMAEGAQQVSENTSRASSATESALEEATTGRNEVNATLQSIEEVANDVEKVTVLSNMVADQSKEIGSILSVIQGISDNTNLLALNAAIEAARAGESGRGFAVVADEVRSLSTQTRDSIKQIEGVIESLQKRVNESSLAIEKSNDRVVLCVEQAQRAGKSLDVISDTVCSINNMSGGITQTVAEQANLTDTVKSILQELAQISDSAQKSTNDNLQSTSNLTTLAQQLDGMVHRFSM